MVNPFSRCGRWITERKFSPDWSLPDLEPGVIERLNRSLFNVIQAEDGDLDVKNYVEAQWTLLAQALYPSLAPVYPNSGEEVEAAAANKAWSALTRDVLPETGASEPSLKQALERSLELSIQAFTDLLVQIEEMDSEPSLDTYAWETMSESLVCSCFNLVGVPPQFLLETWHCLCYCPPKPRQHTFFASQSYSKHGFANRR